MSDVEIRPAVPADGARLVDFLMANMPGSHPAWRFKRLVSNPWDETAPNIGYLAETRGEVVGYFAGIYSKRVVGIRVEQFCNLSAWCVNPAFRNVSVPLVRAILGQKNMTFTALTPTREAQDFWHRMRMQLLDRGRWVLSPLRTPGALWPPGLTTDRRQIGRWIDEGQHRLIEDHASYGCRPIMIDPGGGNCLVIVQKRAWNRVGYLDVLHASDWTMATRYSFLLAMAGLRVFRTPFVAFDARRLPVAPRLSWFLPRDTFFLSATVGGHDIDGLYGETVLNAAPAGR